VQVGDHVIKTATDDSNWHRPESDIKDGSPIAAASLESAVAKPNRESDSYQDEKRIEMNAEWTQFEK
jgi:hypothetical protein